MYLNFKPHGSFSDIDILNSNVGRNSIMKRFLITDAAAFLNGVRVVLPRQVTRHH